MDARDSSTTSSTAAKRDGSSTYEDEAVLSVPAALAKDAALHFQSGKYAECVEVLKQLLLKEPDDPKILHNVAIAEYFWDGCSDPKRLLEGLNSVKKQSVELAQASGGQVEADGNHGNKTVLGSKGASAVAHSVSSISSANINYMDKFDSSIATLNIAIIWFHLHEYSKALSILEPLYQNIRPIDETTALHVCLLLLDVGLACGDASKSAICNCEMIAFLVGQMLQLIVIMLPSTEVSCLSYFFQNVFDTKRDVLVYLEKAFGDACVSQVDSGSTAHQQPTSLVAKSPSLPSSSLATDTSNLDLVASGNATENHLSRTLSEETLEYESMFLDIDVARAIGLSSTNDISRNSVDKPISSIDLKLKLQLYKVRFLLLTRNLKQAKREVKLAMNIARGRDSSMALLLKSQLEYARGNHRKAIKLLMASSNKADTGISSMFHNNLGCIYYQLGNYHTACLFFSKALTNCSSLQKDKPLKLSSFSQDNALLITYNSGLHNLACGKPLLAARCFQKAGLVFFNRSLLWLRLAECCLMASEKGLLKRSSSQSNNSKARVYVIGKGKWRQLVLEDGIAPNGSVCSNENDELLLGTNGQPKLSLPLARKCLANALYLLNSSESNYSKKSGSSLEENESSEIASTNSKHLKNLQNLVSKASLVASLIHTNSNGLKEQKGGTTQELVQNALIFYEDISRRETMLIKQAILASLAYVELKLENPIKALSAAKCLLEIPECSRIYIFLGHVFAAEALCLLNRKKEAIDHLLNYLSGGNDVELPFSKEDCKRQQLDRTTECEELNGGSVSAKNSSSEDSEGVAFLKPEEARAALFVNFACLYAMQGEFDRAHQFVSQALSITPSSAEAILTAVYVDLMIGKSQEALAKLRCCSRIEFLPSGLSLEKSS